MTKCNILLLLVLKLEKFDFIQFCLIIWGSEISEDKGNIYVQTCSANCPWLDKSGWNQTFFVINKWITETKKPNFWCGQLVCMFSFK